MSESVPRRVAYLINQYPKVSHTFIRREIQALERRNIVVDRIALWGWEPSELVDFQDFNELEKTRYVMKAGFGGLLNSTIRMAFRRPVRFVKALGLAIAMSRKAVRPLPYHLVYFSQACRILPWLEENRVTHLHAHFGTNPAEVACLVRCLGGPEYSFTIHGQDEIEGAPRLHFARKIGHAKFAVAVSAYCRAQILREIPHCEWGKLKVVHCGLEEGFFAGPDVSLPETPSFLCIARLSPEKGHLILLDAFAQIAKDHPEVRLLLAGDGPMRLVIEKRIARLGLEDRVTISGWLDSNRIQAEIDKATVLVQPSFIEGLPMVIMEAMARRRPVISTYVAGIPELVTPDTGWLVPAGDAAALAASMRHAASGNHAELLSMGKAGHARAMERHLIDREAQKLDALIFGNAA